MTAVDGSLASALLSLMFADANSCTACSCVVKPADAFDHACQNELMTSCAISALSKATQTREGAAKDATRARAWDVIAAFLATCKLSSKTHLFRTLEDLIPNMVWETTHTARVAPLLEFMIKHMRQMLPASIKLLSTPPSPNMINALSDVMIICRNASCAFGSVRPGVPFENMRFAFIGNDVFLREMGVTKRGALDAVLDAYTRICEVIPRCACTPRGNVLVTSIEEGQNVFSVIKYLRGKRCVFDLSIVFNMTSVDSDFDSFLTIVTKIMAYREANGEDVAHLAQLCKLNITRTSPASASAPALAPSPSPPRRSSRQLPAREVVWRKWFGEEGYGKCYVCDTAFPNLSSRWHLGHIVSVRNAGSNDIANIVPECAACNRHHGHVNIPEYARDAYSTYHVGRHRRDAFPNLVSDLKDIDRVA